MHVQSLAVEFPHCANAVLVGGDCCVVPMPLSVDLPAGHLFKAHFQFTAARFNFEIFNLFRQAVFQAIGFQQCIAIIGSLVFQGCRFEQEFTHLAVTISSSTVCLQNWQFRLSRAGHSCQDAAKVVFQGQTNCVVQ